MLYFRVYKPGDKLKIRSWESMAKESGIDTHGNICLPDGTFRSDMKYLCGRTFTVESVSSAPWRVIKTVSIPIYHSHEQIEGHFCITSCMVELYTASHSDVFEAATEKELCDFLFE